MQRRLARPAAAEEVTDLADVIGDAVARVVRWSEVPASWAGHRPEPLAAERLWACQADGPSEFELREGTARRAGFDPEGQVVIVGPAATPPQRWSTPPDRVDVVIRAPGQVRVHAFSGLAAKRVTTTIDGGGHATRTAYSDGSPDEVYGYDADGRLTTIRESPGFAATASALRASELIDGWIGGELTVVHDSLGPSRVVRALDGALVWERLESQRAEATVSNAMATAIADAVAEIGLPSDAPVHAIVLETDPADWPMLAATIVVATEPGRLNALQRLAERGRGRRRPCCRRGRAGTHRAPGRRDASRRRSPQNYPPGCSRRPRPSRLERAVRARARLRDLPQPRRRQLARPLQLDGGRQFPRAGRGPSQPLARLAVSALRLTSGSETDERPKGIQGADVPSSEWADATCSGSSRSNGPGSVTERRRYRPSRQRHPLG
jgi:hypothetical protein